jgi:hypothetical protein
MRTWSSGSLSRDASLTSDAQPVSARSSFGALQAVVAVRATASNAVTEMGERRRTRSC